MDKIRLSRTLYFSGIFLVSFCVFLAIFFLVEHYIHEMGHMFFGFIDGLLRGEVTQFTISGWNVHPFFKFINLPQQTKIISGHGSFNFALGGPLFSILFFLWLSFFAYSRSKEKKWFLLFLSIFLFEISGNILCGTDNFKGNPLSYCNPGLDLPLQFFAIFLFSGVFSYFLARKLTEKQLKIGKGYS